jgi:hypothetical protein
MRLSLIAERGSIPWQFRRCSIKRHNSDDCFGFWRRKFEFGVEKFTKPSYDEQMSLRKMSNAS